MIKVEAVNGGFRLTTEEQNTLIGTFEANDDGYYVFWPADRKGYWDSIHLREIADKLDIVNKTWDALVQDPVVTSMVKMLQTETNLNLSVKPWKYKYYRSVDIWAWMACGQLK